MTNPIIELRQELNLTRADLTQVLGISYSQVYALEVGTVARPSRKTLQRIALLGRDPERLEKQYQVWRAFRATAILERLPTVSAG